MKYNWKRILTNRRDDVEQTLRLWLESSLHTELLSMANAPRAGEPYGRTLLHKSESGEALLMKWRANQFCAPHDHGGASGHVCLLAGSFVERVWKWDDGNLRQASERSLSAPEVMTISAHVIHSMKSPDEGVSLHLYSPGVSRMQVYDLERRETIIVADDCGAWIPKDERHVVAKSAWPLKEIAP